MDGADAGLVQACRLLVESQWQERVVKALEKTDWTILNPRRDDSDNSWEQSLSDPASSSRYSGSSKGWQADMVLRVLRTRHIRTDHAT
jgi:hypothetical protein